MKISPHMTEPVKPFYMEDHGEADASVTSKEAKRVLEILEFKRKIVDFTEKMLEPEITILELESGNELLCKFDYDNIVQERFLLKLCGFPLCSNELTATWRQQQKFQLSMKDKRIYQVEVRKQFCSVRCMDASSKYRDDNLHEQPIWMRLEKHDREKRISIDPSR